MGNEDKWSVVIFDPNLTSVETFVAKSKYTKEQLVRLINEANFVNLNGHLLYLPLVDTTDDYGLQVNSDSYFYEAPDLGIVAIKGTGDYIVCTWPAGYLSSGEDKVVDDITKATRYADLDSAIREAYRMSQQNPEITFAPALNYL